MCEERGEPKHVVCTYLDDGRKFKYPVNTAEKGREHAAAIVRGGYMHVGKDGDGLEHYPPHRILKVKITGVVPTEFPDEVTGV